jgi:K+-transporting ATPase KdpF subunit
VEFYQGGGAPLGGFMEYAIAGIVAAGLFVYLMYALLRPEKF